MKHKMKRGLTILSFLPLVLFAQNKPTASWNFDTVENIEVVKPLERRLIPSPEIDRSFFVTENISSIKRNQVHFATAVCTLPLFNQAYTLRCRTKIKGTGNHLVKRLTP